MSHLPTERLAALADDAPTADELAHLASCELCARERAIYTALLASSSEEYSRIGTPLTSWDALRPALVADGVIDAGRAGRVFSFGARRSPWARGAWRAAAAVLLVAGGVAAGRMSVSPSRHAVGPTPPSFSPDSPVFSNVDDARIARRDAQALFESASAYLATNDTSAYTPDTPAAMETRLAALERVDEAMREAMHRAPADPVINGYYLTTVSQRAATLQQLNAVAPRTYPINVF
jgi:hypothetical protein